MPKTLWRIIPLRAGLNEHDAFFEAAARDGSRRAGKVNLSGWIKDLCLKRVAELGITVPEPIKDSITDEEIQQIKLIKSVTPRRRVSHTEVVAQDLGVIAPIAPECWHIPIGTYCKRCGKIRMK